MLTLSVQQPWPWAMFNLGKDIENRTRNINVRGMILIHAGKKIDKEGYEYLSTVMKYKLPEISDLETGGIVGCVEIADYVEKSKSKWFFGPYGLVLCNQRKLPFMPMKGRQGFFDVKYGCDNYNSRSMKCILFSKNICWDGFVFDKNGHVPITISQLMGKIIEVKNTYPEDHPQIEKIMTQYKKLEPIKNKEKIYI